MADEPKKTTTPPSAGSAVPIPVPVFSGLAVSTHVATRRTITGSYPVPGARTAISGEHIKPTIAEALRETADAVQEAVRELTGQTRVDSRAPVAILTPTAAQIRQADQMVHAQNQAAAQAASSEKVGPAMAGSMLGSPLGSPLGSLPGSAPASQPSGGAPTSGSAGAGTTQGGPPAGSIPPSARPADLVTFKLDGKEVTVKKGTNVLEACLQHGTDVSYFCYHAGLSAPAVCRQCLVEVVGQPKLVPSCFTPAADKMEVVTTSERVRLARQQMLEFTLLNHPVDCPICDKAGECTLQKMFMDWDGTASRIEFEKVHKPKSVDLGPTIVLDAERCILCTRCIRVCDEVAGQHQLEMAWRGDREILVVAPGQVLDNPYSLNTVDVCPVGALTSKDFRFRMRVWELYTVNSVCPGCATGCNIEIHHAQGEVWRLVPRENPEVNKFWMCDEGRFTYKEVRQSRVAGARFGQGRGLPGQIASVEKAVTYAAERLQRVRAAGGTVGLVFSAQAQNEGLYALLRTAELLAGTGTQVVRYLSGRAPRPERQDKILRSADVNPNTLGARLLAGRDARDFATLRADLAAGTLKALWFVGEDVALDEAALPGFLLLLDKLELVIVQAVHATPLTQRAQVLLPAGSWAEVDGTFTNNKGLVQRLRRSVAPAGDARPHQEIVALLAQKAGLTAGQGWQGTPRQAFLHMRAAFNADVPPDAVATSPLRGFIQAEWGREAPPLQLRFAHSRG